MSWALSGCISIGTVLAASLFGVGCSDACEADTDCDPVACRDVEIQACLDRRPDAPAPWPLGQGRPGSCATEDDCERLQDLGATGAGTGTDTDVGAGGAP